jgi:hypothetical protein
MLLLHLKGGARGLGRLLQVEDRGFLLLAGLPQLLIGHTLLD